jgi:hypothetical protein
VSWTLDLSLDFTVEIAKKESKSQVNDVGTISKNDLNYHEDLEYPQDFEIPNILKSFFSYESLSTYKCPKCLLSNSIRKFFIVEPPSTITIVLKRFKLDMTKDSTFIPFEETLDITGCTLVNNSDP